jgi:hypothetical protein
VAWFLLVAFRHIYNENLEKKNRAKRFESLQFAKKRITYKMGAKESVTEIRDIKKKPK